MKARGLGAFLSLTHTYTHTRSHTRTRTYQLHWLLTPRFIQHISNITRKCPRGDTCHGLTFMLCDRDRYGDKHSCNHSPYCDRHRSITHTDSHSITYPILWRVQLYVWYVQICFSWEVLAYQLYFRSKWWAGYSGPEETENWSLNRFQITVFITVLGTVKGGRRQERQQQKRGGKATLGNGQAWSSPRPRGQWRREKKGRNWLWSHLWCPNDPSGSGLGGGWRERIRRPASSWHISSAIEHFFLRNSTEVKTKVTGPDGLLRKDGITKQAHVGKKSKCRKMRFESKFIHKYDCICCGNLSQTYKNVKAHVKFWNSRHKHVRACPDGRRWR